jgi:hypothetical protein
MGLNPFRSSKWRHKSTTVEMKQEAPPSPPVQAPPPPPPSDPQRKGNHKKQKVPFNSDSLLNGIGDYVFESPLGDGKFSKVMLARHYLTGNQVAIKVSLLLKQPFMVIHYYVIDDQQESAYLPCHVEISEGNCVNGSIRSSEYRQAL